MFKSQQQINFNKNYKNLYAEQEKHDYRPDIPPWPR